jgi:DNA-binding transcriptional ArsR family regulator
VLGSSVRCRDGSQRREDVGGGSRRDVWHRRRRSSSGQADALFHALADPTRRDILAVVLRDAHSVSDLARHYPISFAAVHKHVGALERAGLVTKTRHGREQHVRGDLATLRSAHRLLDDLETLWRERIDRIEQVLTHPTETAPE